MATPMPAHRPVLVRLIVDHNPFYLLSAACMLAGCLALTNTLSWSPVGLQRILVLIATLNVYELLLIGLGLLLIVRRGIIRDGVMLLFLEALFMVDAAFLNSEVFTLNERIGWIVNALLLAAAIAKVWVIFRVLQVPLRGPVFAFVVMQLALLFAMPGVFKHLAENRNGYLPPLALYLTWWVISLVPVIFITMVGSVARAVAGATDIGRLFVRCVIVLATVSLVAHLATATWVYKLPFYAANLAPVLLVMALFSRSLPPNRFVPPTQGWVVGLGLPVAAVLLSRGAPAELTIPLPWTAQPLRPDMLAATGAYLVCVYLFAVRYIVLWLVAGAVAGAIALFGPSAATMLQWAEIALAWAWWIVRRMVPRTQTEWGIVAVVASFALLALGGAISMLKGRQTRQAEVSSS